ENALVPQPPAQEGEAGVVEQLQQIDTHGKASKMVRGGISLSTPREHVLFIPHLLARHAPVSGGAATRRGRRPPGAKRGREPTRGVRCGSPITVSRNRLASSGRRASPRAC